MTGTGVPVRRIAAFLFLIVALSILGVGPAWCRPEYRQITILHTNDIHDHLFPFSYPKPLGSKVAYASMSATRDIGGIARLATLARRVEAEVHGNALLVDAGDILDGTPMSVEYRGEADFAALSAADYDAMVTGNHEFGQSLQQFNKNLTLAAFPVLCANLYKKGTTEPALPPYVIYEFQGVKVAVLGLTTTSIADYKAVKDGYSVGDPYAIARTLVPELKKKADIVVVLSHLGSAEDVQLAEEVPDIDVIVGGHSHARLPKPRVVHHSGAAEAFKLGGTVIVQAYQWAGELGRLDLRLRRDGGPFSLMSASGELIPITSDIPEDPRTAQVLERYYRPISKYYDEVIGEATDTLYDDRSNESAVLNLVSDAIRSTTGAQVGMYGIGGIRDDIVKGPIRVWNVVSVLPFHNKLAVMEITGKRLKQGLERFSPGVSGMRYRMVGRNVVEATVDGKPLDESATYKVATIDWLISLYFTDVANVKTLDTESIGAVVRYVKDRKTISPVIDGRRDIR